MSLNSGGSESAVFLNGERLSAFSREIFPDLARADQRRWANVYLRGILSASGKKTIRNIAGPHSSLSDVQSLRQFINQSTWSWESVARRCTPVVSSRLPPELWVLDSVFIRKRGDASVGAGRWFVRRSGRTINGQMGVALFLSSQRSSVPVDWRILLRGRWMVDRELRKGAGVPEEYRLEHGWEAGVDLLDAAIRRGGPPRRPVVADCTGWPRAECLIRELAKRDIEFLVCVDASALPEEGQIATTPGRVTSSVVQLADRGTAHSAIRVVTQQPIQRDDPARHWVTNIDPWDLRILGLALPVLRRHGQDVERLVSDFGVHDFGGRSFGGWHRHLALVSAAFAFSALEKPEPPTAHRGAEHRGHLARSERRTLPAPRVPDAVAVPQGHR
ncbi:transposase [Streptomyces sp. NPDC088194]|uniref:IS701 family transposase n=1 Tax=Streptomyces sp. NPDC088194 TaxID=3154931 RepID=UPI00344CF323